MMSISDKDALEQWRILYEPRDRDISGDEKAEELDQGADDSSEQPKVSAE